MRPFTFPARSRRPLLSVEPLEGRAVPAGTVTASLSPLGVLTIIGDDDDNGFTLRVTGSAVSLTSDGTTTINSTVPPAGVVKSVRVDLKGGADTLLIHGSDPFQVPGAVVIGLGDGDNTLDMTTTGQIRVGALTVRAGDGLDTATVQGGTGAGSQVSGAASFIYGTGGSSTTLGDTKFGGVRVLAGDAGDSPNEVVGTNVVVGRPVVASLHNANPATVSFTASKLGGLTGTGYVVGALLQSTEVTGAVSLRGTYQADLQVDGAILKAGVAVTAPLASVGATGAGTTIHGNLTLLGSGWTNTLFQTTTPSEVKGAVTVTGGWFNDQFDTNAQFKVGKAVTLALNGGDNNVSIGDGTAAVAIGGNLAIRGGAAKDGITLDRVAVAGATVIATLAGADTLSIENGSTFAKTFAANLGTGDDLISVAQNIGSTGPVTFTGAAKILAGAGNDLLALGLSQDVAFGGDANSRAAFTAGLVNIADGGLGIDTFDEEADQSSNVTLIGWNP